MPRHITVFSRLVTRTSRACYAGHPKRHYATDDQRLGDFFEHEISHDNSSIYSAKLPVRRNATSVIESFRTFTHTLRLRDMRSALAVMVGSPYGLALCNWFDTEQT
jgi:hypothetical protein